MDSVCVDGHWGTICNNSQGGVAGSGAVCSQLGFPTEGCICLPPFDNKMFTYQVHNQDPHSSEVVPSFIAAPFKTWLLWTVLLEKKIQIFKCVGWYWWELHTQ